MNLAPGTIQAAELIQTLDLRIIALPEGSLSIESDDEKIMISTLKNIGLNIGKIPNEFLHSLKEGVIEELRAQEQRALSLIREY